MVGANSVVTKVRKRLASLCFPSFLFIVASRGGKEGARRVLLVVGMNATHTPCQINRQDVPKGQTIVGIPARAIGADRAATYVDTNAEAIRYACCCLKRWGASERAGVGEKAE